MSISNNALSVRSLNERFRADELESLVARVGRPIPSGAHEADEYFRDIDEQVLDEFLERLAPEHQDCEVFVPARFAAPVAWGEISIGSLPMLREDLEGLRSELELDQPIEERSRALVAQRRLWKQWGAAAKDALKTRRLLELVRF